MSHAYDIKARKHALHTVRAWAAKGYQPIYLSGRQGSYYNLTLGEGIIEKFRLQCAKQLLAERAHQQALALFCLPGLVYTGCQAPPLAVLWSPGYICTSVHGQASSSALRLHQG